MPPLPSSKKFIQHISQIRQNNMDYDVVFIIDRKPNARRMIGHSFILSVRSLYFHNVFQHMDKSNKLDITSRYQFKFPEYNFEMFDKILKFVYGNEIDVSTKDSEFLLNLMNIAKRFELTEMVEYLQSYLIESRSSWVRENIFKLIPVAFDKEDFQQLRELIIDLICEDTKWFLSLNQFNELSEKHLIKFLQIENLSIEEFHIWKAVLGWIFIRNNSNLNNKKLNQWSDQEINWFKTTLSPFIPFIRFFQISSFKYWDYIHEFNKVLPEDLVNQLYEYYFKRSTLQENYSLWLPLRNVRMIDSDFISSKQAEMISLWVEDKDPKILMGLEWEYKFNLLYSTNRHGHSVRRFHKYCDNMGATILLVKTNLPGEIIGGYNPISWGNNESSNFESEDSPKYSSNDSDETLPMDIEEESISGLISTTSEFSQTTDLSDDDNSNNISNSDAMNLHKQANAFLFSFNKNGKSNMGKIISLGIHDFIHNCGECGPCFGTTDLWITPKASHSKSHNIPYQSLNNFGYHRQDLCEISLRDEPGGFQFTDYEVFQVVHV